MLSEARGEEKKHATQLFQDVNGDGEVQHEELTSLLSEARDEEKERVTEEMRADLFAMEMSIEEAYAGVSGRKRLCKKRAMLRQVAEMQAQLAGIF